MPSEPFADLRELAARATKRPWYAYDSGGRAYIVSHDPNGDYIWACLAEVHAPMRGMAGTAPEIRDFITSLANQCDALLAALDESRARAAAGDGRAQMVEAAARVNKSERDDAIARADAAAAENAELRDRLGIALDEPHPFVTRCGPSALDVAKAENERLREALAAIDQKAHGRDIRNDSQRLYGISSILASINNPGATP